VSAILKVTAGRVVVERHRNAPLQRVLECVRQQVQHDPFPHLGVDVDRLAHGRTVDRECHAGPFDRRTKRAGEIDRERREIGRHVGSLHTAGLDARELQQRVHQFQQSQTVAMDQLDPFAIARSGGALGEQVFDRPENQR
jgi:hypothetical protein